MKRPERPLPGEPHAQARQLLVRALPAAWVATLLIGIALRLQAAGYGPGFDWLHWRHAHMHLGVYALLFPATWFSWLGRRPVPGPRMLALYLAACVVATIGFALHGYGPISGPASGLVALIWLGWLTDWLRRPHSGGESWRIPVAVGVSGTLAAVVAIIFMSGRDPQLVLALVRSFLVLLLWLVFIPSTLDTTRPRTAGRGILWSIAGLGSAVHLGFESAIWGTFSLLWAILLARETLRNHPDLPIDLRAQWLLVAAGVAATGPGWLQLDATLAVAGLHGLVLGPLVPGWAWRAGRAATGPRLLQALLAAAMASTILAAGRGAEWQASQLAAGGIGAAMLISGPLLLLRRQPAAAAAAPSGDR